MNDGSLNEVGRKLGELNRKMCCLITAVETGSASGGYNLLGQVLLDSAGTDTHSFAAGDVHSFSFLVMSGALTVSVDGGPTVEYTTGMSVEFTTVNGQTYDFVCTSGTCNLSWTHN